MRRVRYRLAMLLVLALLAATGGCLNPARQKLLGQWLVELEMSGEDLSQMSLTENPFLAAMGSALMRGLRMQLQLQFRPDDTCSLNVAVLGNTMTRTGTWRVTRWEGSQAVVAIQFDGNTEPRAWEIQFLGDDAFQTVPPEGPSLSVNRMVTFRRVTAP